MFKTLFRLLILGLCGGLAAAHSAERLRVATEGAYPPFSFTNEQGQLAGFDVDIAQKETAHGKILATQAGTTYADYLQKHYRAATLKFTATITDAFAALSQGEVALVLADNLSVFEFLRSTAGQELDIIGPPLAINETSEAAYIQVRKGDIPLREAINAALRKLWLDGTYHKINARYFPFSIY